MERDALLEGTGRLDALLNEANAVMALDQLKPWSWWVTPKIERRRYDTRFFVAFTDGAQDGQHDEREAVNSCWINPEDALKKAREGEFPLAPPTWWTLKELGECGTLDKVRQILGTRSARAIQPVLEADESGNWMLKLPGHPDHPEPKIPGLPIAVRFDQGRWWAE